MNSGPIILGEKDTNGIKPVFRGETLIGFLLRSDKGSWIAVPCRRRRGKHSTLVTGKLQRDALRRLQEIVPE